MSSRSGGVKRPSRKVRRYKKTKFIWNYASRTHELTGPNQTCIWCGVTLELANFKPCLVTRRPRTRRSKQRKKEA